MLVEERYRQILLYLSLHGAATVPELSANVGASEATIRRDIIALSSQGKLNKVYGGATLISDKYILGEPDIQMKLSINLFEKEAIAHHAASLIIDSDFVFLDAGTTTLKVIDFLVNTKATFVTSGVEHVRRLAEKEIAVYTIAGFVKNKTEAVVGSQAIESLSKYNFTKAFIGTNGITIKQGYTTPDVEEARVKSKAIEQSQTAYVLADSTKFGKLTAVSFGKIAHANIITDTLPDNNYLSYTTITEVTKG